MEIVRKDGIVYERKLKKINYNKMISIRISNEKFDELTKISENLGVNFTDLIREGIDLIIERGNKNGNN